MSTTSRPARATFLDRVRRALLPRVGPQLYFLLRRLLCVAAPFVDAVRSGQARSAVTGKVVDAHGGPLPWLTYPAINFLGTLPLQGRRVLEFGSGYSTQWWAQRAESVTAFEADARWLAQVREMVPANVTMIPLPTDPTDRYHRIVDVDAVLKEHLDEEKFDVIVIDGVDRVGTARASLPYLADDGIVIVDNSDSYVLPDGSMPLLDVYRDAGFQRVDFYGMAPSVLFPQCTSIAFREGAFAFRGGQPTAWRKPFERRRYGNLDFETGFVAVNER